MRRTITKTLTLLLLLSLSYYNASAQETLNKETAKEVSKLAAAHFKFGDYSEASRLYEQLVMSMPDDGEFNYKLGVCYLRSNSIRSKAIAPLEKANQSDLKYKDVKYYLAKAYMYDSEYDKAIENFESFMAGIKGKDSDEYQVKLHLSWCYNAKDLTAKPITVNFKNIGEKINTQYPDYNPLVDAADSAMIFTSNRNTNQGRQLNVQGQYPADLYSTVVKGVDKPKIRNLGINVNTWFFEKGLSFSPNGQTVLFSKEGEKGEIDLYVTTKAGRSFGKSEILSDKFLTKYDEANACLSADGEQLFFAAELKGGLGGLDIYRCEKESNGVWTDPVNLGDAINSPYDEDNPQLYIDDKTLFFSSEGHNSMGGLDVFMSQKPSPQQSWSKARNLGYPLNDAYDNNDFFLTANSSVAYMSAIREDGVGDRDIYRIKFEQELLDTKLNTVFIQIINPSGQVSKGTAVLLNKKSTGEKLGRIITGSRGEITQFLPPGEYGLVIKTRKLGQFEESITIPDNRPKPVRIKIKLKE